LTLQVKFDFVAGRFGLLFLQIMTLQLGFGLVAGQVWFGSSPALPDSRFRASSLGVQYTVAGPVWFVKTFSGCYI
jgi:hypothetical protein